MLWFIIFAVIIYISDMQWAIEVLKQSNGNACMWNISAAAVLEIGRCFFEGLG